ncbi:TonB-dependent receptor plug domain-containing protein [Olivibacter sitiensis]|uniref:TonB-dependent receptor plug domain-containing protein n=1 Tax=Olivibacter sitiensis TaxID=376470 RepID=UPI00041A432D|nr:TonB-dependent receptor plug domain-containing protein [Olivibacter sitiensis]
MATSKLRIPFVPKAIVLGILLFAKPLFAQDSFTHFMDKMGEYSSERPQEKIHLHLDKPYYLAGDDLWFKAYVTAGQFNFLSNLSKVIYVELIDGREQLVQSLRLPLVNGLSLGDFKLADTLAEGNYRIRAYTNWMRNFDTDFFFDQTLQIGNTLRDNYSTKSDFIFGKNEKQQAELTVQIQLTASGKTAAIPNQKMTYELYERGKLLQKGRIDLDGEGNVHAKLQLDKLDSLKDAALQVSFVPEKGKRVVNKTIPIVFAQGKNSIRFFPESGVLLNGIINKVGFKALRPDGLGIPVSGIIINNKKEEVSIFQSSYAGMGNFMFLPEDGKSYFALVDYGHGDTVQVPLPKAQSSGYVLTINNELERQLVAQVSITDDLISEKPIYVVVQQNGAILYGVKGTLNKSELLVNVPREKLTPGVMTIALLDEHAQPLAERTVFNYPHEALMPLKAIPAKKSYDKREKVDLQLESGTALDSIRNASLSISVVNLSKLSDSVKKHYNILTSLLLSSAIKGYIENPAYYFCTSDLLQRKRDLDNLMLTQGWSKILWQAMTTTDIPPLPFLPEQGLEVSGQILKSKKTPVPDASVTMLTPVNIMSMIDTIADSTGRFRFDNLYFPDSTKFVIQARDAKGKRNVDIVLDTIPPILIGANKNAADRVLDVNDYLGEYLAQENKRFSEMLKFGLMERSILLDEVEIKAEKPNPAKNSANLNGPGNADQVISGDELFMQSCPNLAMCLQGRLTGVIFNNGIPYSTRSQGTPMQIVLDGMYVEAEMLSSINAFDVASIEVLRSIGNTAIYGTMGGGGLIVITTRRGDEPRKYAPNLYTPGIVTLSPQGYTVVREFYSPDYSVAQKNPDMADLRTTIYWEPNLITDEHGKATAAFYTADEAGQYQIIVEGIDLNGRIGHEVLFIEVD